MKSKIKNKSSSGELFIVSTPIGNVNDITDRAKFILSEVDLIASEDTRKTLKLCKLTKLTLKKIISYNDNNSEKKDRLILNVLKNSGSVALVCDAGTPLISDPGYSLINLAIKNNIKVTAIPGASSLLISLVVSGLPISSFYFVGFPPKKSSMRKKIFSKISSINCTSVWYESPKRVLSLLNEMYKTFGNKKAVITRELTKLNEEIIRGKISYLINCLKEKKNIKGEIVVMLEPIKTENEKELSDETILYISNLLKKNSLRSVVDTVVAKTGKNRNLVYKYALIEKNKLV